MNAIKKLFQEINFNDYIIEKSYKNKQLKYAIYNQIEVLFNPELPTYFMFRDFSLRNTGTKYKIRMFFKRDLYKDILKDNNFTYENSVLLYNGMYLVSSKLLWIILHWCNRNEFINYFYTFITSKSIYHDIIKPTIIKQINNKTFEINYFGIITNSCIENSYVSLPECKKYLQREYKLKETNYYYTKSNPKISKSFQNFKDKCLWKNEDLISVMFLCKQGQTYIHPNLMIYYLDKYKPFEFWNTFISYYEIEMKLKEELASNKSIYKLNPNNSLIKQINNEFVEIKIDKIYLLIHKKTSYIQTSGTSNVLNKQKYNHIDRWMMNNETLDFIKDLEHVLPKTSECDEINEQFHLHPSYFKLTDVEPGFNGYYLHPELFMYFVIWLSKKEALKYIKTINILYQKSNIDDTTNNKYLNEEIYRLKIILAEKEHKIHELEKTISKITCKDNGSVKIKIINRKSVKLQYDNYNQVETKNSIVIRNVKDSKFKCKELYDFIHENNIEYIKTSDCRNIYEITDSTKINDAITFFNNFISNNENFNTDYSFNFNNEKYIELIKKYEIDNSPRLRGFLYELEASKFFNAFLYHDLPKSFLNKFKLNNVDKGIDLINIRDKVCYQCKCYKCKISLTESLQRTLNLYEKIHSIDNEFKLVLLVNDINLVSDDVLDLFNVQEMIF